MVAVVWAAVYLAPIFNASAPAAPPAVSAIMLAVVTWLFGAAFREGLKERARRLARALLDDKEQDDEPRE